MSTSLSPTNIKENNPRPHRQGCYGQHRDTEPSRAQTTRSGGSKIHTGFPNGDLVVRIELGPDRFSSIEGGYDDLIAQIRAVEMQQRFIIAVTIGEGGHSFIQPRIHHDDLGIRYGMALIIANRTVYRKAVIGLMRRKTLRGYEDEQNQPCASSPCPSTDRPPIIPQNLGYASRLKYGRNRSRIEIIPTTFPSWVTAR